MTNQTKTKSENWKGVPDNKIPTTRFTWDRKLKTHVRAEGAAPGPSKTENEWFRSYYNEQLALAASSRNALPPSLGAQNAMPMPSVTPTAPDPGGTADVTLRIGPVLVDVAQGKTLSTVGYNGQVPGPLIRLPEGRPIAVHVFNDTDTPEFVHWHGQFIPSEVNGAGEKKSLVVPPRGQVRYRFTPRPAGLRWVHTHVMAGSDLYRGLYTGKAVVCANHQYPTLEEQVDPFIDYLQRLSPTQRLQKAGVLSGHFWLQKL